VLPGHVSVLIVPAAQVPAKQRGVRASRVVDRVCTRAYDNGLSPEALNELVDIITLPNELDQASIASIIKNLYPANKVSDITVIKVVGSLGHGQSKPGFPAQAALLKWLVMVYDVLENQKVFSQLYSVLFNLLDTIGIR
jgi:centromere protein I